jgi:hypothetical protein
MKNIFIIIVIFSLGLIVTEDSSAEVREMMLVCGIEHGMKESNIYVHIKPESISMIERNSKVRDKTTGSMRMVLFVLDEGPLSTIESTTNISESIDQKSYESNLNMQKITLVKYDLILKLFKLDGSLLERDECSVLASNIFFDEHIQDRVNYLHKL